MDRQIDTILLENRYYAPFFKRIPISVDRGEGVYVWDEAGNKYIDFTAGWGVTCIGHANPVITNALLEQVRKIIQNPNASLTYSPPRAQLLSVMKGVLPDNLSRIFFTNSGAESNDAAIKLARKVSGKRNIISTHKSFHGRTISTASATGQAKHREKFNPLMPNYVFVPYDDVDAISTALDGDVAAVILEPIQGEGGVNIPSSNYLKRVADLCMRNHSYLIIDEVQTGFCRTGPMFAIDDLNIKVDFLTMAKGIAGGFPFGAFAVSEQVSERLERGDHGGTYCGNPLGCAVARAVIQHLKEKEIGKNVLAIGVKILERLHKWHAKYSAVISAVRGKGLLIALELYEQEMADRINTECLNQGLFINIVQGNVIRIFPALNISERETEEGLDILENAIDCTAKTYC